MDLTVLIRDARTSRCIDCALSSHGCDTLTNAYYSPCTLNYSESAPRLHAVMAASRMHDRTDMPMFGIANEDTPWRRGE